MKTRISKSLNDLLLNFLILAIASISIELAVITLIVFWVVAISSKHEKRLKVEIIEQRERKTVN